MKIMHADVPHVSIGSVVKGTLSRNVVICWKTMQIVQSFHNFTKPNWTCQTRNTSSDARTDGWCKLIQRFLKAMKVSDCFISCLFIIVTVYTKPASRRITYCLIIALEHPPRLWAWANEHGIRISEDLMLLNFKLLQPHHHLLSVACSCFSFASPVISEAKSWSVEWLFKCIAVTQTFAYRWAERIILQVSK